jgi:hypothetical protein
MTFSPASNSRAPTPSPGRRNSTNPLNIARRVCHAPLYWYTPIHLHHLHSSQMSPWGSKPQRRGLPLNQHTSRPSSNNTRMFNK